MSLAVELYAGPCPLVDRFKGESSLVDTVP